MTQTLVATTTTTLLLVDDEPDILESLTWIAQEAGYATVTATSLELALECLRTQVFDLVLTDLLDASPHGGLPLTRRLRAEALPTPTALLTAWRLPADWEARAEFVFVATKPFDLDDLLASIAEAVALPWTSLQQRHRRVVKQYFAALERQDWQALRVLGTPDLRYSLDRARQPVTGLDAYIGYARQRMTIYPSSRFQAITLYPLPEGIAARFSSAWTAADGTIEHGSGGVMFRFRDERIAQIGVLVPSTLPLQPDP